MTEERKDLVKIDGPHNPFTEERDHQALTSAADIEIARAIAEIQASYVVARKFPRDPMKAMDEILRDCTLPVLAESATFEFPRGGQKISGASIRLAEAIARRWGNIRTGVVEISRHEGFSECKAFAEDLQTGYKDEKTFQVNHWRDTRDGGYLIKDERDIYELVANMGARRKRACILSIIPMDVVEQAERACEITLRSKIEITDETLATLLEAFKKYSVTREMIEQRLQRRFAKDTVSPGMVMQLKRIYNSLEDGMSKPADWFKGQAPTAEERQDKTKRGRDRPRAKGADKNEAPKPAADDKPADATALDFIRNKAKLKTITEAEICKAAAIEKLEALPAAMVEAVLAWIDNPMQPLGAA